MALMLAAVGVVIVAVLATLGRHHLYLFGVLRRWPDPNDVALRRRELALRETDSRSLAMWWGRYQARHARPMPRRWAITGVLATLVLAAAGLALLVDDSSSGGPSPIRRDERAPATTSQTIGGVSTPPTTPAPTTALPPTAVTSPTTAPGTTAAPLPEAPPPPPEPPRGHRPPPPRNGPIE